MKQRVVIFAACALLLSVAATAQQYSRDRGRGNWNRSNFDPTPLELEWENDPKFEHDVFTFARVRFASYSDYRRPRWMTDYPDSDSNFSYRLQQLTSLKVNPKPVIVSLDSDELFKYPFIYMCEPGRIILEEDEIVNLRRYLLNGGFLMADDFWGDDQYQHFANAMRDVFPDREPMELPLEHEVFNCVYELTEKPQIPSIHAAWGGRNSGRTWETWDSQEVHYKALFDDDGRMMAIICHNTDLGDGWEREGVDEWYFREFSEKKAYPLGINIVTYAMTH